MSCAPVASICCLLKTFLITLPLLYFEVFEVLLIVKQGVPSLLSQLQFSKAKALKKLDERKKIKKKFRNYFQHI